MQAESNDVSFVLYLSCIVCSTLENIITLMNACICYAIQ